MKKTLISLLAAFAIGSFALPALAQDNAAAGTGTTDTTTKTTKKHKKHMGDETGAEAGGAMGDTKAAGSDTTAAGTTDTTEKTTKKHHSKKSHTDDTGAAGTGTGTTDTK